MMDVSGWVKNSAECYLPEKCYFGQTLQSWYHEVLQMACRPSDVCGSFHGVWYSQRRRYPSIFHSHPLSLWLIPNPSKVLKVADFFLVFFQALRIPKRSSRTKMNRANKAPSSRTWLCAVGSMRERLKSWLSTWLCSCASACVARRKVVM